MVTTEKEESRSRGSEISRMQDRLVSLDAFRGITIAGMILVNKPGSWEHVYPPLLHADWHGWTPTDLIFPFFLFIVGVAMVFSFAKRLQRGDKAALSRKVLWRTAVIFLIGLLLNLFPEFDLADMRVTGVLQRIAVVYLFASLIVLNTGIAGQSIAAAGILIVYWLMMTFLPVPGQGAGVLTPEGNLAAYLDRFLLPGKMWQGSWDPEGILSTVPAVSTALFGVLTGHWLRSGYSREEKSSWLFVAGWLLILAGIFWGIWFPINKNIWTSSYVLFTAGAALQFLGICYWLIDVKRWRAIFYPAVVFGTNAITVYVLSGMLISCFYFFTIATNGDQVSLMGWIYENLYAAWLAPKNASLGFALSYVFLWFLIMDWFYRRRIFIKI